MKNRVPAIPLVFLAFFTFLTGCGGESAGSPKTVDLTALFSEMAEACGWDQDDMAPVEGDLLEAYYPGLRELSAEQLVAMIPAMSSDVNEIVLMQCETEADAETAAAIFQARIDSQIDGGAWYAETQAAWEGASVLQNGTYTALIASGTFQESLEDQFRQQFS